MEQFANKLTEKMVLYQIIKDEDKDLYSYGIWQGIILLSNFVTVIVISCLFQMLWQGIVFTIAYGVVRSYAGGYHARSQSRCYLFSIILISAVLSFIKFIQWSNISIAISVTLSSIIILALAPMEDENKRLDEKEYYIFKKRTYYILLVLIIITLFLIFIGKFPISICTTMAICTSAFMLILGKIKSIFE
ncbi:MAG: accessory gene regulator B family protein [Lachnospiraceae bacterium]|nr:accessory gene regulator B family protein [Lachnospiraceae bacterium]